MSETRGVPEHYLRQIAGQLVARLPEASGVTAFRILNSDEAQVFVLASDGDLTLAGTVDGVDVSAHAANADAHHAGFIGLQGDTPSNVDPDANDRIRLIGGTGITITEGTNTLTFDSSGAGGGMDVHTITGVWHSVVGSQFQVVGLTATDTLGLLTPSSDPGAAQKILKTDASGYLALQAFKAPVLPSTTKNITLGSGSAIWSDVWGYMVHVAYDASNKVDLWCDNFGDLDITPSGGTVRIASDLFPYATDTYDLGSSTKLWRKGWLSEMEAILFVENTITLLGGWFYVPKYAGTAQEDVDATETQIDLGVSSSVMAQNDFILFRQALKVEYMQLGTYVGSNVWNVTRNVDGSGANTWPQGAPYCCLGYGGDGRIELNAYDTPRVSIVRQGTSYNAQTELVRMGDLNGLADYTSEAYGIFIGDYAGDKWLAYDPTKSLRIRGNALIDGTVTTGKLDAGAVTVEKLDVVVGGYNVLINSGINDDDDDDGVPDEWTEGGTATSYSESLSTANKIVGVASWRLYIQTGNLAGQYRNMLQDVVLADVPLAVGDDFVLSGYVDTGSVSNGQALLLVQWLDSGSGVLQTDNAANITTDTPWTRYSVTNTVPAGAVKARVRCRAVATQDDGTVNAYFDAIKLERGDVPTAWTTGMIGNVIIDSNRVQVQDSNAKVWIGKRGASLGMWGEDTAGNLQVGWYASGPNAGAIVAGGSVLVLNDDGIDIEVSTAYYDERSYQFSTPAGAIVSRVGAYYNTTGYVNAVEMIAKSVASYDSTARVRSESPTGEVAQAIMSAYHGAAKYADLVCNITTSEQSSIMAVIDGTIRLNVDPTGVDVAGTLAVTGGITATTTVKATGDIWADEFSTAAGSNRWRLGAGLAGQPPSITHKVVIEIDGAEWWLAAYPNH